MAPHLTAHERAQRLARDWLNSHSQEPVGPSPKRRSATGESLDINKTSWFSNHNIFAVDQFYESFTEFEEAALPNPNSGRARLDQDKHPDVRLSRSEVGPSAEEEYFLDEERAIRDLYVRKLEIADVRTQARLRAGQREVLLFRYNLCMTLKDIGDKLGISYQAVQQRLTRALRDYGARWQIEGPLLAAAEVATFVGVSRQWVRKLANSNASDLAPIKDWPVMLWSREQARAMRGRIANTKHPGRRMSLALNDENSTPDSEGSDRGSPEMKGAA